MKHQCNACGGDRLTQLLTLGQVPIAHRFLKEPAGPEEWKHPMTLHTCTACGLIQIVDPVSPEELYRDYNFCFTAWKPQPHMKNEIALMKRRVAADELIVEIGSNDGGFLSELKSAGFKNLAGVEPNKVANEQSRKTGASIYEGFFCEALGERLSSEKGKAALAVSRQVLEHIPDLRGFARGVKKFLKPGGFLLLEIPDFESPMAYGDVSSLWEEHVNYFTESVLADFLEREGFGVDAVERYPFSGGALMILARLGAPARPSASRDRDVARALSFTENFPARAAEFKRNLLAKLEENKKAGIPNTLYGTGCRANMLLNGLGLHRFVDQVIDDQKEKQGLFMPGSAMKIMPSSALHEKVGACFLSVNAENEEKVMARHADYVKKGGKFYSVNSPSPLLDELRITALTQ